MWIPTTTDPSGTIWCVCWTGRPGIAPASSTAWATPVYTLSDPRAVLLKKYARHMAQIKGYEEEFDLLQKVEELGIPLVQERRHSDTPMCANVDMYSGLVYTMLDIPEDVFTPLFASARIAGWCANRMEEVITGHRIMRPAYRAVTIRGHYVPMEERTSRIKEFDL